MNAPNHKPGDLLERAVAALRQEHGPGDPPAALLAKIVSAGADNGLVTANLTRAHRSKTMKRFMRIAAAVAVVLGAGVAAVVFHAGSTRRAFSQVVAPLLTARSATYTAVIEMANPAGQGRLEMKMHGMFMEPALMRNEMHMEIPTGQTTMRMEMVQVFDMDQGLMLQLMPEQKMAMYIELENMPPDQQDDFNGIMDLREGIRQAQEKGESVEFVGELELDGQPVVGYRFEEMGVKSTVWADPRSYQVVQVEIDMPAQKMTMVMRDFEFNVDLDENLFDMEVPQGYRTQTMQVDVSQATEDDLVQGLQTWAQLTGGSFPTKLDLGAYTELAKQMGENGLVPDEDQMQEYVGHMIAVSRAMQFAMTLPDETHWQWAGESVEFGDAARAIFWYRPEGSELWRVLFGDLTWEEVPVEPAEQG